MGPNRHPDPAYTKMNRNLPYFGTREQVFRGLARYTKGFLTRDDLIKNKRGRLVSKTAHQSAQRRCPLGLYLATARSKLSAPDPASGTPAVEPINKCL
jgi:hypothetical protein